MPTSDASVRSVTFSFMSLVLKADPEFYAKKRDVLLFEFSNGREFRGDPNRRNTAYPDIIPDE